MSIFRRRAREDTSEASAPEAEPAETEPTEQVEDTEQVETTAADSGTRVVEPAFDRASGPFDASEVDGPDGRIDLGALWMRGFEGMELRLEVDQEQDAVVAAVAVLGDSAVQLQAFAAPKSGGLWTEIRDEIAQSIVSQGGTSQEKHGPLGIELATNMPSAGPGGRKVYTPARFTGVDGPRWFLRAVFSGRAASDDAAAAPLLEVVRSAVVVRGDSPMAPRELLPLALPTNPEDEAEAGEAGGGADDGVLDPFERGPEITEVR